MAYVSRDPFGRAELHRTKEADAECAWCGQQPAYRYRVESDGGRVFEDRKTFCRKSCRTSYTS